ncbi:MAG: hypothetical protein OXJ52_03400 [Oligoflexia bacterium]|nr:hypothetical protein [Oligoflexia bacterium]
MKFQHDLFRLPLEDRTPAKAGISCSWFPLTVSTSVIPAKAGIFQKALKSKSDPI